MSRIVLVSSVWLVLFGCGDGGDPFAADGGGGNSDSGPAVDGGPGSVDAGPLADAGPRVCAEAPTRLVVLGDSIVACSTVGGVNNDNCSSKIIHGYIDAEYANGVSYENKAAGGAVTEDVPDNQLGNIDTGMSGHALVLIYIGGNDLQPYIFIADDDAEARFAIEMPVMLADWDRIFAFFDDTTKFPDGVTIIMNTQYNPFDDCTASPYNLSAFKIDMLHEYNDNLTQLAQARSNVIMTNQHASYLGHGHHYDVASCPHYSEGAVSWMGDLIHPNVAGHANLADEWKATADLLYRDCE